MKATGEPVHQVRSAADWRVRVGAVLLILLVLVSAGLWFEGYARRGYVLDAVIEKTRGLAELISRRSPGTRVEAELVKTKHVRSLAMKRLPLHRRPASQQLHREQALLPVVAVPLALVDLDSPSEVSPGVELATLLGKPPVIDLGGSSVVPGGSGSPTPPGSPPKQQLPSPSPVPEPVSWATMLVGFALVGWRIRRSDERSQKASRSHRVDLLPRLQRII